VANMEDALFSNAKDEAKTLVWAMARRSLPGRSPPSRVTSMWMVEEEVQGQKVLVPVVYLTDAQGRHKRSTPAVLRLPATMSIINGGAVKNTGGTLLPPTRSTSIPPATSENIGGRIAGWNVQLNAGGDIVNSTLVKRVGDNLNGTNVAQRVASIEAGNTAILKAANNIKVSGAQVTAGKDAALIAGKNVDIQALALTNEHHGLRRFVVRPRTAGA